MSNASLKDQLKAAADQLSINLEKDTQKPSSLKRKPISGKKPVPRQQKNNKPKPAWLEYAHRGVALLKKHYPNCFFAVDRAQPLKKGIKQDLIKRLKDMEDVSSEDKACMIKSLSYYVNTLAYLKKVVAGAARLDLDGKHADTIKAEEATYSLERLQAKQAARVNANKKQQTSPTTKEVPETV